jgi:hypothetical protein
MMLKEQYKQEYWVWAAMLDRCRNPRNRAYHNYGGSGIAVCERWKKFKNFIADMGARPSPRLTIERENTAGDYEPGNCKWATYAEQARNKRRYRTSTSGVTGVNWLAKNRKWLAVIRFNGKRQHLGLFDTIEEAAAVRARRALELGFNPGHGSPRT